jgi:integrase
MPVSGTESWTVLDDDWGPVVPVEQYLAYLSASERSPGTVRAYAFGLKFWSEFLASRGLAWDKVGVDAVAQFVAWLRAPADNVVALDTGSARRSPATVNRHLASVFGLYDYHARTGVPVASDLIAWKRIGRGSYKPFLHHLTKGRPAPTRPVKLAVPRQVPRTLTDEQVLALLAACGHLRDRFLLALLAETGMFSRGPACSARSVAGVGAARGPRRAVPTCATPVVHVPAAHRGFPGGAMCTTCAA